MFGRLRYFDRLYVYTVLMGRRRQLASIILILLCCTIFLVIVCPGVIQPSREDLIEASFSLLESPVAIDLQVIVFSEDVDFKYDTQIMMKKEKALWEGEAVSRFAEKNFYQKCRTICEGENSCKEYRTVWVKTETVSPYTQIRSWLSQAASIRSTYHKKPISIKDITSLFEDMDNQVYVIETYGANLYWNGICDAYPDNLFGGRMLFERYSELDTSLYFDTDTNELVGIHSILVDGSDLIELSLRLHPTETDPQIPEHDVIDIEDGLLNEEWSFSPS